jgi:hypothetical protein
MVSGALLPFFRPETRANTCSHIFALAQADTDAENCANSKASPYSNTAAVILPRNKKRTA